MKAITIQPPWSTAVKLGAKRIENRSTPTSYRGEVAIHAGKRWSKRGAADKRVFDLITALAVREGVPPAGMVPWLTSMDVVHHFGCIVALADLIDVHPDADCCRPWGETSYEEHGGKTVKQVWHYVLDDVGVYPEPVPCRGALGFWTVPEHIELELAQQTCAPAPITAVSDRLGTVDWKAAIHG